MPYYDEIKSLISETLSLVIYELANVNTNNNLSYLSLIIAIVAIVVSILIPFGQSVYNRNMIADNMKILIDAYITSFEKKIQIIEINKKWTKNISFEEYNRKNYEALEVLLSNIHSLNRKERDAFISFIVSIKTSDEMCLSKKDISALNLYGFNSPQLAATKYTKA